MNKFGRFLILFLFLLAVVGGFFGVRLMIDTKRADEQASQTISESISSSTNSSSLVGDNTSGNNIGDIRLPTATTTTPSDWKTYTNNSLGYSISYPGNLVLYDRSKLVTSTSSGNINLTFPKDIFFHWPLQDDAVITLTVGVTCTDMVVPSQPQTSTTTFSINGYSFTARVGDDAGAGNRYREIAYDTEGNGLCYHISLYDHGVNGAGFYVDGQALIQKYDSQHDVDMKAVIDIFNSIVNSFRLQPVPVVQ